MKVAYYDGSQDKDGYFLVVEAETGKPVTGWYTMSGKTVVDGPFDTEAEARTQIKRVWLNQHGYVTGPRDARLNTNFPGTFMVTEEEFEDYDLPTANGASGPWCIVGDDLDALIADAYKALS